MSAFHVRRRVVDAFLDRTFVWRQTWHCQFDCGHFEPVTGRGGLPPRTAICSACSRQCSQVEVRS